MMPSYVDELLFVNEDSIVIDTGLSTREAAQAKIMQFLVEPGYIADVKQDGTVSFTVYTLTDTFEDIARGRKNTSVFLKGPAYQGVPLIELLNGTEYEETRSAITKISTSIEAALEQGITLPPAGPLGTLVGDDGTILFLPDTLLNRALTSRGESIYASYEGSWKNTALVQKDALRFTAAAYAYTLYTGQCPFPQKESQIRVADYYDRNFSRLNWFCKLEKGGVPVDTAEVFRLIEQNLSCSAPEMESAKKKKSKKKTQQNITSTAIEKLPEFDRRIISPVSEVAAYQHQQKKLKRIRFFRKNSLTIKVCLVGAIIAAMILGSYIKDYLGRPTTLGMEPVEVIQTFYKAFDTLDSVLFDSTRTNGAGDTIGNIIASFFVTAKMRESYEAIPTYTPSQWFNTKNPDRTNLYGLSRVEITESVSESTETMKVYDVHYYVIHTEPPELLISNVTDKIVASWRKDRWLVTYYDSEEFQQQVDYDAFYRDLKAVVPEDSYYDPEDVINALQDDYPWLPTLEEVQTGRQQLIDKYESEKI